MAPSWRPGGVCRATPAVRRAVPPLPGDTGHSDGGLGLRSASKSLRQPFAICCPFQACASAIPAAASWRRVDRSVAGSGASALLSCSELGSLPAGVMTAKPTQAYCQRPRRACSGSRGAPPTGAQGRSWKPIRSTESGGNHDEGADGCGSDWQASQRAKATPRCFHHFRRIAGLHSD